MINRVRFSAVIVCFLMLSCGIFTPRDSFEMPVSTPVDTPDYFNFGQLLDGTKYSFSKLDWYELFHEDVDYTVIRTSSTTDDYSQLELINWLSHQHDLDSSITVEWVRNIGLDDKLDTLYLNDVSYSIFSDARPDSVLFHGDSRFKIIRGSDKIWRIVEWIDTPVGLPFFAPEQ